jgi:hypothetical protein
MTTLNGLATKHAGHASLYDVDLEKTWVLRFVCSEEGESFNNVNWAPAQKASIERIEGVATIFEAIVRLDAVVASVTKVTLA